MIVPTDKPENPVSFPYGSKVCFTFNGSTAHLFDPDTQKNLEL